MKSRTALLVGCGDIGTRVGLALVETGYTVHAVRRRAEQLPDVFEAHGLDYTRHESMSFAAALRPDLVLTTFNPFDRSVSGYARGFEQGASALVQGLAGHRPEQVIMASSTRVFAERDGGWVDENSSLTTDDESAQSIIAAERILTSELAASVVRFGGIYGAPGGRLVSRILRGEICPAQPVRYTNRIHREDCAGFLLHLFSGATQGSAPEPVYLGVDDYPAPRWEVESWLAERLGVAPEAHGAQHEPTRHNAGHKRCRNSALHRSGYTLRYPDYRSGYAALLGPD